MFSQSCTLRNVESAIAAQRSVQLRLQNQLLGKTAYTVMVWSASYDESCNCYFASLNKCTVKYGAIGCYDSSSRKKGRVVGKDLSVQGSLDSGQGLMCGSCCSG